MELAAGTRSPAADEPFSRRKLTNRLRTLHPASGGPLAGCPPSRVPPPPRAPCGLTAARRRGLRCGRPSRSPSRSPTYMSTSPVARTAVRPSRALLKCRYANGRSPGAPPHGRALLLFTRCGLVLRRTQGAHSCRITPEFRRHPCSIGCNIRYLSSPCNCRRNEHTFPGQPF